MPLRLCIWTPLLALALVGCRFHPGPCTQWVSEYQFQASTQLVVTDVASTDLTEPPTLWSVAIRDDERFQTCLLPLEHVGDGSFRLTESICGIVSEAETAAEAEDGARPDRYRLELELSWPDGWPPAGDTGGAPEFETLVDPAGATQAVLWEGWEVDIAWDGPWCGVELE